MQSVANAIDIVLSVFLMAGVGIALYRIGWLNDQNLPLISRLTISVALPATIISTLFAHYTPESLIANAPGIGASFLSVGITYAAALPVARLLKLPPKRGSVFVAMFTFSNSVFIGLPISLALFGDSVTPYTLLYYIANTICFWALAFPMMRRAGIGMQKMTPWQRVRQHMPLPLVTFFICAALIFLRISPPKFVMTACDYIGVLVTPLALIYAGAIIMRMIRQGLVRWQRGYCWLVIGRFLIGPALLLLCAIPFRLDPAMRNVLMMQSAMPAMTQIALTAGVAGCDEEYAAGGVALTTALILLFVPLYMYLIDAVL